MWWRALEKRRSFADAQERWGLRIDDVAGGLGSVESDRLAMAALGQRPRVEVASERVSQHMSLASRFTCIHWA